MKKTSFLSKKCFYNYLTKSKFFTEFYQRVMPSARMFMHEKNLSLDLIPKTVKFVTRECVQEFYDKYMASKTDILQEILTKDKIDDSKEIDTKNDSISKLNPNQNKISNKMNTTVNTSSIKTDIKSSNIYDQTYMYKKINFNSFLKEYNLKTNDKDTNIKLRLLLERSITNHFNKLKLSKVLPLFSKESSKDSQNIIGK